MQSKGHEGVGASLWSKAPNRHTCGSGDMTVVSDCGNGVRQKLSVVYVRAPLQVPNTSEPDTQPACIEHLRYVLRISVTTRRRVTRGHRRSSAT